jgi:hypothetical protein
MSSDEPKVLLLLPLLMLLLLLPHPLLPPTCMVPVQLHPDGLR